MTNAFEVLQDGEHVALSCIRCGAVLASWDEHATLAQLNGVADQHECPPPGPSAVASEDIKAGQMVVVDVGRQLVSVYRRE